MAQKDYFNEINAYLAGNMDVEQRARFERALSRDGALQEALEQRWRETMAMDQLEVFLDEQPGLSSARKTWLQSLFATVMLMGNFSTALQGMEKPEGLRQSDEHQSPPGDSA